jgi:hypothetical protein
VAFSRPSIFIAGNYVADESLGPRLAVFPHWLHVEVIVEGRQLSLQAAGAKLLLKRETLTADDFPAIRSARVTGEPRLTVVPLTTFSGSPAMLCSTALQVERRA